MNEPILDAVSVVTHALEYGPDRPRMDTGAYAAAIKNLMTSRRGVEVAAMIASLGYLCQVLLERLAELEETTPADILQGLALTIHVALTEEE